MKLEHYTRNIDAYDEFHLGFLQFASRNILDLYEDCFKKVPLDSFKKILEVGVGSGVNMMNMPSSIEIHGIDRSEAMINVAKERIKHAHLIIGNAEQLPYDDNSFDCVFVLFVLCASLNPKKILSEVYRVCKPGAYVSLFDYHKNEENPLVFSDQQFLNDTMKNGGMYFKGVPIIVFDTLYSLDENISFEKYTIHYDKKLSNSFSESFRGTVLQKR
jgi:ubiquinone/menaquinone biosynthesis C-methylase UbiE